MGTWSFSPVVGTVYYVKLVITGDTILGYIDTDGYGHTWRWTATVSRTSAGYFLVQVEYLNTHDAHFDNLKVYTQEAILVTGLTEDNFVELLGSGNAVITSAYADGDGNAALDFSASSSRPPYHKIIVWEDDTKAVLIYARAL